MLRSPGNEADAFFGLWKVSRMSQALSPPDARLARRDGPVPGNPEGRDGSGRGESPCYAALDLGTNNCRLLIARPQAGGGFRIVEAYSRIVRLGAGLNAH